MEYVVGLGLDVAMIIHSTKSWVKHVKLTIRKKNSKLMSYGLRGVDASFTTMAWQQKPCLFS